MSYETLTLEQKDGVAHLKLNRPKAANAIDLQMGKDLMHASIALDEDRSVRAVVIGAEGKMFCAGGDLASFADSGDKMGGLLKELTTYLHAAISRFARMRAPVIAAVNGTAAGAGFSMMCATDLAIAAESAKFTMAYTGVGLSPDGSSSYYLPRLIGTRRTLELMLTNRRLSAAEALEWGLVSRVVPGDQLPAAAQELAAQMAGGPTKAFGGAKRLLLSAYSGTLETQLEDESASITKQVKDHDGREGIEAFAARRKPEFKGR